jgi:TorA maturation chaperone TorD
VEAAATHRALDPEDQARADFYALLARLYADAPDAGLLAAIAQAPPLVAEAGPDDDAAAGLPAAWDALRAASAAMDGDAIVEEYNNLFIGVGKCEVNLHASHWLTGFMMEKPLVDLRTALADLGLGRQAGVTMLEDHLAALCETMRILIAGNEARAPAPIATQRAFFERQIAPWVFSCCTAIANSSIANYYCHVAQFAQRYMALERDSLAID